jgi:hypothetical protein
MMTSQPLTGDVSKAAMRPPSVNDRKIARRKADVVRLHEVERRTGPEPEGKEWPESGEK